MESLRIHIQAELLVNAYVLPFALKAIIKLGVLEILSNASAPISASCILSQISGCKSHSNISCAYLERTLKLLASYNLLSEESFEEDERKYDITDLGKVFLEEGEDGASLAPATLLVCDEVFINSWMHLDEAILEGSPAVCKAYGNKTIYDLASECPILNEHFNKTMASHSNMCMPSLLNVYKGFANVKFVVDVGGGVGASLAAIMKENPHIQGINLDQAHVIASAPPLDGVEHVGGDMLESIPEGDAIYLKWILHNWDDEKCVKILKNCFKSLPDDGKVIVVEAVIPSKVDHSSTGQFLTILNMFMMVMLHGKERTLQEYRNLALVAGFSKLKVAAVAGYMSIIEFHK